MPPPLRLPVKTVYLSSCSRSARRARSSPCCAAKGDRPPSAIESDGAHGAQRGPQWSEAEKRFRGEALMATATYDLNELKRRMQGAIGILRPGLTGLRAVRAFTDWPYQVQAGAYGSHMPLNQLATISVPEPR